MTNTIIPQHLFPFYMETNNNGSVNDNDAGTGKSDDNDNHLVIN